MVLGLVRSAEKARACEAFGIVPVHGDLADHDLLASEASAADAVVNAASSDDRPAIDALLRALAGSGKALLHTSGSSIVADDAGGEPSDAVIDEDHLPGPTEDKAARVALDQAILATAGIRTIVLCNALIFGEALGPKARSVQLPLLIDYARETGNAAYIGRGLNRWSTVHIADVVELYLRALERSPAGTFAFVESGEAAFADMARSIADGLGLAHPISMTIDAAEARWGRARARYSLASNSRVRTVRAPALGWSPTRLSVHQWIADHLRGTA
jgi:nucleoside-diphosphate-sugar epimerase